MAEPSPAIKVWLEPGAVADVLELDLAADTRFTLVKEAGQAEVVVCRRGSVGALPCREKVPLALAVVRNDINDSGFCEADDQYGFTVEYPAISFDANDREKEEFLAKLAMLVTRTREEDARCTVVFTPEQSRELGIVKPLKPDQ